MPARRFAVALTGFLLHVIACSSQSADTSAPSEPHEDAATDGPPLADSAIVADRRADGTAVTPGSDTSDREAASSDTTTTDGTDAAGANTIDPSTMDRKVLFGYQGWFACPGDGSLVNGWVHWFRNGQPTAANLNVDLWPDTSELDSDELFPTEMTYGDASTAKLYSAHTRKTVVRHFRWMRDAGIDGVLLQRFLGEIQDPRFFALRNQVTESVRAGAEQYGRVFAIEYDTSMSMADEAKLVDWLETDWKYMVDALKVTESPQYLHHRGKPVLFVWGLGFSDRPGSPVQAQSLIDWLKTNAETKYRATVVGGVPTNWRTLTVDSKTDPAWATVYRSFDVISPWTVGRYGKDVEVDDFRAKYIVPDMAEATKAGAEYMPVVFPGFSWRNLKPGSTLNEIPRRGGELYWRQVYGAVSAGATFLKTAMFDEVDEGTAMYKVAATAAQAPVEGQFVTLDADGLSLPSDFYLRLGGLASKLVRGELSPSVTVPITQ